MAGNRIVLGTRGSDLARAQTRLVEEALRKVCPDLAIDTKIIRTHGDDLPNEKLDVRSGRKGIFTREIEEALLRKEIDVAVHSAKDLPSQLDGELEVCATLPRASVDDVLLTKAPGGFESVPRDGMVASGSVRRQSQIHRKRPDIRLIDVRGNVPTRLQKFTERGWHGLILARAGLDRLGIDSNGATLAFRGQPLHRETLSHEDFLPAGGQGAIALEVRRDSHETTSRVAAINHSETLVCLRAEREFLRLLGGDCNSPVGVLATIDDGTMTLRAQVFGETQGPPKCGVMQSPVESAEGISAALYLSMYG